jgi:hypothetical protein
MSFNKEMQRALKADGDKLHQLTGEHHGPVFIDEPQMWTCPKCHFLNSHMERRCIMCELPLAGTDTLIEAPSR